MGKSIHAVEGLTNFEKERIKELQASSKELHQLVRTETFIVQEVVAESLATSKSTSLATKKESTMLLTPLEVIAVKFII